jgi:parallel beta-helix repeat protein
LGNVGAGGAALYVVESELALPVRNVLFEDNRATETMGGAVLADSSRLTLANCTFRRNSSVVAGGAVAAVNRSFVSVSHCEMLENHAAQGGAIHGDAAQLLIGYCVFAQNTATAGGSAIGVLGRYDANVNQIFSNNTFYKNTTNGSGATVFAVKTSPEIRKDIFVVEGKDQLAVAGVESAPLYECNLIYDPAGGAIGSLPSGDTLVGDPLFCDPAKGNFDIRDLSPANRATCGPVGARPVGCKSFQVQPAR